MGFSAFAKLDLEEYIAAESAPDELCIFVHIPKTAGSSFASELSDSRPPYRNIHVDYEDETTPHHLKMDRAVDQFVSDAKVTSFRACSGHITMQHVLRIREAVPRSRVVSILRNPIDRIISDFRYARTPAHPPYKEFIRQFPTIESYVDSLASQNKMFKFLSPDPEIPMAELFEFLDEKMSFIGLVEMYPMSFNIVTRLFGSNKLPSSHKRKTETTQHNQVERTTALIQQINKANARDVALFKYVRDRLMDRREQWLASRGVRPVTRKQQ